MRGGRGTVLDKGKDQLTFRCRNLAGKLLANFSNLGEMGGGGLAQGLGGGGGGMDTFLVFCGKTGTTLPEKHKKHTLRAH